MEMEPSQLARGMDVDIGMGLGDDLGGFEGFDAMFAEPNSTTDFFKFCALEDAQQYDAATMPVFKSPPSPVGKVVAQQRERDFAQEGWNTCNQQQIEAWPSLTCPPTNERVTPNLLPQSGGKPRARKRHDEDQVEESAFPVIKVGPVCCFISFSVADRAPRCSYFFRLSILVFSCVRLVCPCHRVTYSYF